MVSTVNSRVEASPASSSAAVEGKLAALKKRENALKQQLGEVGKPGTTPAQAVKTGAITQQIGYVESQIEQVLLAAQLSRLGAAVPSAAEDAATKGAAAATGVAAAGAAGADAAANANDDGKAHGLLALGQPATAPYRAAKTAGKYINVRA